MVFQQNIFEASPRTVFMSLNGKLSVHPFAFVYRNNDCLSVVALEGTGYERSAGNGEIALDDVKFMVYDIADTASCGKYPCAKAESFSNCPLLEDSCAKYVFDTMSRLADTEHCPYVREISGCPLFEAVDAKYLTVNGISLRRWASRDGSSRRSMVAVADIERVNATLWDFDDKQEPFAVGKHLLEWMLEAIDTMTFDGTLDVDMVNVIETKRRFKSYLNSNSGITNVVFTKADGTERKMRCVSLPPRNIDVIPEKALSSVRNVLEGMADNGNEDGKRRRRNPYVVPVLEIAEDKAQIRSVDVSRIISMELEAAE